MYFILSNSLTFDPETKTLSLFDQPESTVNLSAPAVRLLLEFIKNRRKEISRDMLITRVWQDFGYTPSGNNLNKAVSEIRKAFQLLGVHTSPIVTIPGVGFYFDADVVEQKHPSKNVPVQQPTPKETVVKQKKNGIFKLRHHCFFAALAIAITVVMGHSISEYRMKKSEITTLPSEKFEQCTIWRVNAHERPLTLSKLSALLEKNNVSCQKEKYDIYYFDDHLPIIFADEVFIGTCPMNKDSLCKTIRYKSGI
ncbi:TPA: transcriptional regulator [Serratia rubidaea]